MQAPDQLYPRVGAATFVVRGTEILLGRSNKLDGKIVIPGGGVMAFESVNDAARREILEETGVHCLVQDVLFVSEVIDHPKDHRIIIYMLGQYVAGDLKPGDDLSAVFWADTRTLSQLQNDMTDLTVDAIYKFSLALKGRGLTK